MNRDPYNSTFLSETVTLSLSLSRLYNHARRSTHRVEPSVPDLYVNIKGCFTVQSLLQDTELNDL